MEKWIPEEESKKLFTEELTTPTPAENMKSTNTAVVSAKDFAIMFGRNRDIELSGIKVNRLMIDIAYATVATGNLKTIAEEYNVKPHYLRQKCLMCQDFQKLLNYFCEAVVGELKAGMVNSADRALRLLDELIQDETLDPELRFKVAKDVLDRTGIKEDNKSVIDVNNNVNFMAHMSQEEVAQYADFDISEVIDVTPTTGEIAGGREEVKTSKD